MTLLKIEDAMFSFVKTPEGITNLPIANTHFCRIFGSVDLRAFSPRPADFTLAPPRPAPQKNAPPRTSLIAFIPIVAESLGGWHQVALDQFRKLGSALARHTGQEEGEKIDHLVKRVSILLQKGLSAMLLNRIPGFPAAEVDGLM